MKSIDKYTQYILDRHNLKIDDVILDWEIFSWVSTIDVKDSRNLFTKILGWFKNTPNNKFDIIQVDMKTNRIVEKVIYEIWCNNQERFINKKHIYVNQKYLWKWYGTIIFDNIVNIWKTLGCHSIYAECSSQRRLHNGWYTWAVMWYDFDHDNEAGIKMRWEYNNFLISEHKFILQKSFSIHSLYELLSTKTWREYREDNHFSFQGKFDLTPSSKSLQVFDAYKIKKGMI
jgi:hypothetical protein